MKLAYSSSTLAQCAQVSLRMLQWWAENDIAEPVQQGRRRLYSPDLALLVMIVAELKRKHLTLFQIRKVLPGIKRVLATRHSKLEDLMMTVDSAGRVHASPHCRTLLDALLATDAAAWAIHVGDLANRLPQIPTAESRESAA